MDTINYNDLHQKNWISFIWRKIIMLKLNQMDSPPRQKIPQRGNQKKNPNQEPDPYFPQDDYDRKKILDSLMTKQFYFHDHIICSRC